MSLLFYFQPCCIVCRWDLDMWTISFFPMRFVQSDGTFPCVVFFEFLTGEKMRTHALVQNKLILDQSTSASMSWFQLWHFSGNISKDVIQHWLLHFMNLAMRLHVSSGPPSSSFGMLGEQCAMFKLEALWILRSILLVHISYDISCSGIPWVTGLRQFSGITCLNSKLALPFTLRVVDIGWSLLRWTWVMVVVVLQ